MIFSVTSASLFSSLVLVSSVRDDSSARIFASKTARFEAAAELITPEVAPSATLGMPEAAPSAAAEVRRVEEDLLVTGGATSTKRSFLVAGGLDISKRESADCQSLLRTLNLPPSAESERNVVVVAVIPFRQFDAVFARPVVDSVGGEDGLLPRVVECGENERLLFLSALRNWLVEPQNLPFNPVSFDVEAEEDRLRRRFISALFPKLLWLTDEEVERRIFDDGGVEGTAAGRRSRDFAASAATTKAVLGVRLSLKIVHLTPSNPLCAGDEAADDAVDAGADEEVTAPLTLNNFSRFADSLGRDRRRRRCGRDGDDDDDDDRRRGAAGALRGEVE